MQKASVTAETCEDLHLHETEPEEPGKEKTGPVSQRVAERPGEFRMSTT